MWEGTHPFDLASRRSLLEAAVQKSLNGCERGSLVHLCSLLWSGGPLSANHLVLAAGWAKSITAFGFYLVTLALKTAFPHLQETVQLGESFVCLFVLPLGTFSLSKRAFCSACVIMLVVFYRFHSLLLSVGNDPSEDGPSLHLMGFKLGQCASWGGEVGVFLATSQIIESSQSTREGERHIHTQMYHLRRIHSRSLNPHDKHTDTGPKDWGNSFQTDRHLFIRYRNVFLFLVAFFYVFDSDKFKIQKLSFICCK